MERNNRYLASIRTAANVLADSHSASAGLRIRVIVHRFRGSAGDDSGDDGDHNENGRAADASEVHTAYRRRAQDGYQQRDASKTHERCNGGSAARAPKSTSVGLFKCVEPPVRCDSTVDRLM